MVTKFFDAFNKALSPPSLAKEQKKALDWFRDAAKKIQVTDPELAKRYLTDRPGIARIRPIQNLNSQMIGRLIMFQYYAKGHDKLPYWDKLPVIFPIRIIQGGKSPGFLGLNLHYLPPTLRAKLMDAILTHYQDKYLTESKRLQLDYQLLNNSSRYRWFRPCIKRYLFSQVRSRFNLIDPMEWAFIAFLPIAQWQKAPESKVWSDSRKIIKGD